MKLAIGIGWQSGSVVSGSLKTVTLPQGGTPTPTTPAKIDATAAAITAVNVCLFDSAYVTVAATDALGVSQCGADATRQKLPAGVYSFQVASNEAEYLYFTETGEAADVTQGLSYHFVKG